ncbi:MAG: LPXTG cell wall anchor domain-containing protein [Lachnospiraceae bacterium]|nr:LPXTG cell wall anchor domain-containing protein [Lachnospiraceae bacterium]
MKKLLATVLAVVLAMTMILGTALAADQEIATSNATITDAINGAAEGSTLVVTVKYTAEGGTAGAGWGIGGICIDGTWTVDGSFESKTTEEPNEGDVLTFEFNVDDIKKAASGDINLNYYNGFAVQSAVLKSPAAGGDDGGKDDGGKGGDAPKTADTMTVVMFAGIAILALGAVVVTKKARA